MTIERRDEMEPSASMGDVADTEAEVSPFMTVREAAEIADVDPRTMAKLCEQGTIRAARFGKQWRINREAFMTYAGLD